jgi:hypothetical protein
MDFAWVVDALRRGLKVTRKAWAGDPPMYLYTSKTKNGKRTVMFCDGSKVDREACFRPDAVLDATDWEEYVDHKKEPAASYISLSSDEETRLPNNPSYDDEQDSHGGEPVEEPDLDEEANKAIALVARNIAEDLVELLRNPSVQRLLQKTDVPLSKEDTNHV